MSLIVYLAMIAAIVVTSRFGPGRAMLNVYLPVLLMIPHGLFAKTPGHPGFAQAAMLPIIVVALQRYIGKWRPTPMDLLMMTFAVWVAYSDYSGRGYADAQSLMLAMLTSVMAPYMLARLVIPAERLHIQTARRFVWLVFVVALLGLYEWKFGWNPFLVFPRPFFPGQGDGWVTTFRYGMARVAGPYSHAILAGIIMVIAYRIQRWLEWGGHWERSFKRVQLPKARTITIYLLLAVLMTGVRGPWLGAIVGASIIVVGRAKNRKRALMFAGIAIGVGGIMGAIAMNDYLDIKPGVALTMSQESAMYRKVLFEKYFAIAVDHVWFGWGLTTWPKVPGMESIDNYYLLLSLMHGVPAMLMLVTMMIGGAVQCVRRGLAEPVGSQTPAFMFAAIFVIVFVSLGTVYMGEQVQPVFFFILGWAQGWLKEGGLETDSAVKAAAARPARAVHPSGFRGVIQ